MEEPAMPPAQSLKNCRLFILPPFKLEVLFTLELGRHTPAVATAFDEHHSSELMHYLYFTVSASGQKKKTIVHPPQAASLMILASKRPINILI
jgi:hypothetical protein